MDRQYELDKLEETINIVDDVLIKEKYDLEHLTSLFSKDKDELYKIEDMLKLYIINLEYAKEKPYFARIDFLYDGGKK